MRFCPLLADLARGEPLDGFDQLGAVPDLEGGLADAHVDHPPRAALADGELLSGDGDDAVDVHGARDPGRAGSILAPADGLGEERLARAAHQEPGDGRDVADRRVRPVRVVAGDEDVDLVLGGAEGGEDPSGEELLAQRAVEALDLAGRGGAARGGQSVGDPVLAADAVEERLGVGVAEACREDLPVVGQDLLGDAVAPWRPPGGRRPGAGWRAP